MSPPAAALALGLMLAPPATVPEPAYRIGAGDVLEVTVEGRPDLSRIPTVQTTGTIWIPGAGNVSAQNLTVDEIAAQLRERLAAPDAPPLQVVVRVKEYQSQFAWIRGAVARPGRIPLRGATRLVDALLEAGGFLPGASGDVTVERADGTFADGGHRLQLHFPRTAPTPAEMEPLALPLRSGDVVVASRQEWVVLTGAVRKPGRYAYEAGLTLGRLLASSGGLLAGADRRVRLLRRSQGGSRTVEIEADVEAIRRGKAEDPQLQPDDEVSVKVRRL